MQYYVMNISKQDVVLNNRGPLRKMPRQLSWRFKISEIFHENLIIGNHFHQAKTKDETNFSCSTTFCSNSFKIFKCISNDCLLLINWLLFANEVRDFFLLFTYFKAFSKFRFKLERLVSRKDLNFIVFFKNLDWQKCYSLAWTDTSIMLYN